MRDFKLDLNYISKNVLSLMYLFEQNNYEIFLVGGAVRDLILGKEPHDFDLTTNALPEEMIKLFESNDIKYIPTGLKHGTITAVISGEQIEVTTYRIDGDYSDSRHPDAVKFTKEVVQDLLRRDLTINAMAANSKGDVIDLFNGVECLQSKPISIQTVGDSDLRFTEDALRVLRAYRFASQLDGKIDIDKEIIQKHLTSIRKISAERVHDELCKYLMGRNVIKYFEEFIPLVAIKAPRLMDLFIIQNNKWHTHQLLTQHTAYTIAECPKDLVTRVAALLHDIGKHDAYSDEIRDGIICGHSYKHPLIGVPIAEQILDQLKFSNDIKKQVLFLIEYHDNLITYSEKSVKKVLRKITELGLDYSIFDKLIDLKYADRKDHFDTDGVKTLEIIDKEKYLEIKDSILSKKDCFSLKQLVISGDDLIELGIQPGPKFKEILTDCLDKVVEGELQNNKEVLLKYIKRAYI